MDLSDRVAGSGAPVYRRDLPGGGWVLIQVDDSGGVDSPSTRTRLWVERRGGNARRAGHTPVIIAEVDGDERSPAFADLYRIASDNAAIARALLEVDGRAG